MEIYGKKLIIAVKMAIVIVVVTIGNIIYTSFWTGGGNIMI